MGVKVVAMGTADWLCIKYFITLKNLVTLIFDFLYVCMTPKQAYIAKIMWYIIVCLYTDCEIEAMGEVLGTFTSTYAKS